MFKKELLIPEEAKRVFGKLTLNVLTLFQNGRCKMKLTRTDLCVCRYICCVCSVVMLHVNLFFSVILWVLNLARIFMRTFNFAIFLQSRNAKLKTLRK